MSSRITIFISTVTESQSTTKTMFFSKMHAIVFVF